jgi:hypothetical protein
MNPISDLQSDIVARLAASEFFAGPPRIDVLSEDRSDWLNHINRRLMQQAGGDAAAGIVALVVTPEWEPVPPSIRQIEVALAIQIYEHPIHNHGPRGSHKRAGYLMLCTWGLLNQYEPPGGWSLLEFERKETVQADSPVIEQIIFRTRTTLNITPITT